MGRQTAKTFSSGNPGFVRYLNTYPGVAEQGCSLIRVENTSWDGAVSGIGVHRGDKDWSGNSSFDSCTLCKTQLRKGKIILNTGTLNGKTKTEKPYC